MHGQQNIKKGDSRFLYYFNLFPLNINLLTLNVNYSGRTAPITSKVAFYIFIKQI